MSTKYGRCLTRDCDTGTERGGCPIQLGGAPACDCTCHAGTTGARPLLASRRGPAPVSVLSVVDADAGDGLPAAA